MKRLVLICRHGEVSGDGLTERSRTKVEALAERVKERIGNGAALVLYSVAPHVAATAYVFKEKLGTDSCEATKVLWVWEMVLRQGFEMARLAEERFAEGGFDAIIMVTQGGGAEVASEGYGDVSKAKGFKPDFRFGHGDAVILDFGEGRLEYFT